MMQIKARAITLIVTAFMTTGAMTGPALSEDKIEIDTTEGSVLQEFVIIVSDMDLTLPAFTDVLKWKVKWEGPVHPSVLNSWGLPKGAEGQEVLVGNDKSKYGFVRLVELSGVEQELIRPGARWWDTGGMLNINVLVKDHEATRDGLRALGWYARSLPEPYVYPGNVKGVSSVLIGPDDLMVSFQERQSHPMTGWPEFEGATHIEVGYEMGADVETWHEFYSEVVGFTVRDISTRGGGDKEIGPNDFGLPHNTIGLDRSRIGGARPKDGEQLLGVRTFVEATGYDFSDLARPPNIGIASVRIPVADVDALAERINKAGHALATDRQIVEMAPYGKVKLLAVRNPGGADQWVEFFEPGAEPMTEAEFKSLLKDGGEGTWQAFRSSTGGISEWNKDGSARITFGRGEAKGTWVLKGNAMCTSWTTLRDGRESCARYYHLGDKRYQSFTMSGQPEGFTTFK